MVFEEGLKGKVEDIKVKREVERDKEDEADLCGGVTCSVLSRRG